MERRVCRVDRIPYVLPTPNFLKSFFLKQTRMKYNGITPKKETAPIIEAVVEAQTPTVGKNFQSAKIQNNPLSVSDLPKKSGPIVLALATTTTTTEKENAESRNFAALIGEELERAEALREGTPEVVGMLRIKSANETIVEAQRRPDPKPLWLSLWYEGEVCCLFADSNLGKSIYAVQIGESIARTQRVMYFDFELSDKQFQLRYTDEGGSLYKFSDNFYRVEIDKESLDIANFEDTIISNIESASLQSGTKVLIIDNLTWLCTNSEKGDDAGKFMKKLMALKKKHDLSMLIIAHTPKRNQFNPISTNDLAGSKKLYNFFDSCFAIGQSAKDSGLRYVKQMKVRHGEFVYDSENVIVYRIEKNNSFLQFVAIDQASEREHLKQLSEGDVSQEIESVKELGQQGLSVRDIANRLNMSKSKVHRLLKK